MRTFLYCFLVCVSFSSCISAKYYNTYYVNLNKISKEKFKPTKSLTTYDYNENNLQYFNQNGYVLIGYNSLRYTYIDRQEAINTGCWIGATVMLYKYYRVPEQHVALFQKPNSSSNEIMVVKQNEWFEIISKANKDFYKVVYEGNTGYISARNQFK